VLQPDGSSVHVLLPFLLNSGGDCLLGEVAFRRLLDAGAKMAESPTAEAVLCGVRLKLPLCVPGGKRAGVSEPCTHVFCST
jgi:hypothetical protein